jgi:hypothetical protein
VTPRSSSSRSIPLEVLRYHSLLRLGPPSSEEWCGALPLSPLYAFMLWCLDTMASYGRGSIPGREQEIFLYSTASRPALGPTQPPIQWVPGSLSPGLRRQGRKAGRSAPSSAEVKNGGAISPLSHTSSWRDA